MGIHTRSSIILPNIVANTKQTKLCVKTSNKKRLKIDLSLYTILQIFSVLIFEKMPILQALTADGYKNKIASGHIQLNLFES